MAGLDETPQDKNALTRAFGKRKNGKPFLPDEEEAFAEYIRRYRALRMQFHCVDVAEKDEMKKRAKADGYRNFGKWLRAMVRGGMSKTSRALEEWQALEARANQAEKQLETQTTMSLEILQKSNRYERERDLAVERLRSLETRLLQR